MVGNGGVNVRYRCSHGFGLHETKPTTSVDTTSEMAFPLLLVYNCSHSLVVAVLPRQVGVGFGVGFGVGVAVGVTLWVEGGVGGGPSSKK